MLTLNFKVVIYKGKLEWDVPAHCFINPNVFV